MAESVPLVGRGDTLGGHVLSSATFGRQHRAMFIRSRARLLWLFVLRFAALIALSFAVLAGISLAQHKQPEANVQPSVEPGSRAETALA